MARRSFSIAVAGLAALLCLAPPSAVSAASADRETARFGLCSGPGRVTCVVDGDTFWYRGQKIRIADINAPEVSHPGCASAALVREGLAEAWKGYRGNWCLG
uniref:hypothetical protein n=1 Tax=Altererythrobacter segetis TaxID=1104773 RepID=UPI00140CC2F8